VAETVNEMFQGSVAQFADLPALARKRQGQYQPTTYRELAVQVRQFASGLAAIGVVAADRIALISENRPEWVIADLGMLALGAVNVPMFPTVPAAQVEYIVGDSGARVLIVSDGKQLGKGLAVRRSLPGLTLVAMDAPSEPENGVMGFQEAMSRGAASLLDDADYEARWRNVQPDDLASIVYTSGTTGDPKGVMLTHRNLAANTESCHDAMRFEPGDVFLSFLPLNHCLERVGGYYLPLRSGCQIAYAESLHRLRENIRETRPTCMVLVPRVCEAFHGAILERVAKGPPVQRRLVGWALAVGRRRIERLRQRRPVGLVVGAQWGLADALVLRRLREAAGFDRLRAFISGGAPLGLETALFFHSAGMPILEGYGLTESSPVITFSRPGRWKLGTVGQPLRGVEVRIGENGEICCRGPNVTKGYYRKPEATAEAIDQEGWLHTGDIGDLDRDGFLRITDRLKDLLVLTNGKKVAPQPIESTLQASPYVAQVVLVGDRQATVGALIVPAFDRVREWATQQGINLPDDHRGIAENPEVERLIRGEIDRLSGDLADFERIHGFTLLDHEFTLESGELTPTLKVKRRVVVERHAEALARLYGHG